VAPLLLRELCEGHARDRLFACEAKILRVAGTSPQKHSGRALLTPSNLICIYATLWIAEGIFRKWYSLGGPTIWYTARDLIMVVLLVLFLTAGRHSKPRWTPTAQWLGLGIALLLTWATIQAVVTSTPLTLLGLGLRAYVVPLGLALFTELYGDSSTLRKVSIAVLLWLPVQAGLAVAQTLSDKFATINRVSETDFQSLVTANDVVRATGTFTSAAGLATYAALSVALVIAAVLTGEKGVGIGGRRVAMGLLACLVLLLAVAGSRGIAINGAVVILATLLIYKGEDKGGLAIKVAVIGSVAFALMLALLVAPAVLAAFEQRFADASASEDTIGRVVFAATRYANPDEIGSLWGDGVGTRAAVGQAFNLGMPWTEDDQLRTVHELGLLGYFLSGLRSLLAITAILLLFNGRERRDPLAVSLLITLVPALAVGQLFAQPSTQGYAALLFSCALLARRRPKSDEPTPVPTHAGRALGEAPGARGHKHD